MAEAEVKTFWQRQRLAEAEVENPHNCVFPKLYKVDNVVNKGLHFL